MNNIDFVLKKSSAVPDDMLKSCAVFNILAEQNVRVNPVTNHLDQDVNQATQNLISAHASKYAQFRILMQVSYFIDKIY